MAIEETINNIFKFDMNYIHEVALQAIRQGLSEEEVCIRVIQEQEAQKRGEHLPLNLDMFSDETLDGSITEEA